jgi:hypothetical protein
MVCAFPITRKRITVHIPAETNARNNMISFARQRCGKEVLSTIQAVSVGSVQSGYKRVDFQSWHFSSEEWRIEKEGNEIENEASLRQSFIVSCCNWLWLREIIHDGVTKSNHPLQNPRFIQVKSIDENVMFSCSIPENETWIYLWQD